MKATIVPTAIIGANHVLPAKTLDFALGQTVTVRIGEPINVEKFDGDPSQLSDRVKESIQKLMDQV